MTINSILLLLFFFLSSCSHQKNIWPAYAISYHNFTGEEIVEIKKHLSQLNSMAQKYHDVKSLISFDKIDGNFEIIIKFNNENGQEYPRVAGTALRKSRGCVITIYPVCFEKQLLKTVIWHELGHCAKLDHTELKNDIMYKLAKPFDSYKEEDIDRFIQELNKSIWK